MYTPARSDLIALVLAAGMTTALTRLIDSDIPVVVAVAAFLAIPLSPAIAAWLSGPSHSMRSRFVFRGAAGIAGMAAGLLAAALLADTYDIGRAGTILFAVLWVVPFSGLAFVLVLVIHALAGNQSKPA